MRRTGAEGGPVTRSTLCEVSNHAASLDCALSLPSMGEHVIAQLRVYVNAWSWVQSAAQAQALELRQADLEAREESARQALRSFEEQQRRCALVFFAHSIRSLYCCHQRQHSLLVSAEAESNSCSGEGSRQRQQ